METILLLAEFDVPLSNHITKLVEKCWEREKSLKRKGKEKSKGRGNLVSMLSKTTVNTILSCIKSIITSRIVAEVGDQKYSVQMDSTQDTAVVDQESIILRYVLSEEVKERLFALKKVTDSTGFGLYQQFKDTLHNSGLKVENIAGASFDGAANMRGEYKRFAKVHKRRSSTVSVYLVLCTCSEPACNRPG